MRIELISRAFTIKLSPQRHLAALWEQDKEKTTKGTYIGMFHISLSYIYIITKILIKINFFYKARNGIRTRVIFCLEGRRPKPLDHTCKKEMELEGLEPSTFCLQSSCSRQLELQPHKSRQRDLNPRHTAYKAVALPTVLYRHKQFSNMLRFNRRQFNIPTIVWTRALIIVSIATTSLIIQRSFWDSNPGHYD